MKYMVMRLQIDPHMEMISEGTFADNISANQKRIELMDEYGVFTLIQVVRV